MTRCRVTTFLGGALLGASLVPAQRTPSDTRVVGAWQGNAGGDPLLNLGRDGRYASVNLTQTKTIPPERGTYEVLPLARNRAKGRLAGAKVVRLRYDLPDKVARTLHRDPVVVRELVFVPSVPALIDALVGDLSNGHPPARYLPARDLGADARFRRWFRRSP